MPDSKPDQEPSIEEILASIRQIISDDDDVPAEAPPPPPPPKAAPPPAKPDVLELTDVVEEKIVKKPAPMPEPEPDPPLRRRMEIDMLEGEEDANAKSILTPHAASAAMEGFTKLTSHMALDREGTGAVTIEDIVKEMLRPMLREWLDANLPQVIEKLVQKELDQIARRAMEE
jgi:cell pole-organizing protein PopZ